MEPADCECTGGALNAHQVDQVDQVATRHGKMWTGRTVERLRRQRRRVLDSSTGIAEWQARGARPPRRNRKGSVVLRVLTRRLPRA
jgi:hypothetical protein